MQRQRQSAPRAERPRGCERASRGVIPVCRLGARRGARTPSPSRAVDTGIAIVGAGALGLACAAELARIGRDVVVIERHDGFGRETTSRNSGVVHAGLYYVPGSLKAASCVEGRELLYARCAR